MTVPAITAAILADAARPFKTSDRAALAAALVRHAERHQASANVAVYMRQAGRALQVGAPEGVPGARASLRYARQFAFGVGDHLAIAKIDAALASLKALR